MYHPAGRCYLYKPSGYSLIASKRELSRSDMKYKIIQKRKNTHTNKQKNNTQQKI